MATSLNVHGIQIISSLKSKRSPKNFIVDSLSTPPYSGIRPRPAEAPPLLRASPSRGHASPSRRPEIPPGESGGNCAGREKSCIPCSSFYTGCGFHLHAARIRGGRSSRKRAGLGKRPPAAGTRRRGAKNSPMPRHPPHPAHPP